MSDKVSDNFKSQSHKIVKHTKTTRRLLFLHEIATLSWNGLNIYEYMLLQTFLSTCIDD